MARHPPDILITTPESLYLLLTSAAREILRSVETVIVDEIHSLVPSKRGCHLFLSLERLEELRPQGSAPLQRVGLSATQRPLEEVARLLGGGEVRGKRAAWKARKVSIVDTGSSKKLDVRIEVPVEDMSLPGATGGDVAGPRSIWPSMFPRLVEAIRSHHSTLLFVNSRRLAERLATAINETAGEELALAHHGSIARERRQEIEDRLKAGELPAMVATSTLELGIDMGAVDLVLQVESPPSVASGLQRIGRAGHSVGEVSRGIIFPKHRGDLLTSAAAVGRILHGGVEEMFYPRNPLDVLAQQIVAITSVEPVSVDALFRMVRQAAPFSDLPRASFEGVLDMLSGRYPSDEFAQLRARLTWNRVKGELRARQGARHIAVANAGTIPDRGLYGVFLAGVDPGGSRRVGELDEEMVFESREGDIFLLGASSWRIEDITHDRVTVTPAPGQPGKMPFWHGDRPGRPLEFGRAVGELARTLVRMPRKEAVKKLRADYGMDSLAAGNLLDYLEEQVDATGEVPSDQTLVVERYIDEVGDWRLCVLSPLGARVHAPWATAVLARLKAEGDAEFEMLWSDDGMVFRLPESAEPLDTSVLFPPPEDVEDLIVGGLAETSLFAARFRENAGRALLLPRRRPGKRSPLWAQRKRSRDLLAVASRYGSFPVILETYRECLRDVFDVPGLIEILSQIRSGTLRVHTVDSRKPSPFAASLVFSYVANFIYDGDMPLAERKAQALSVDLSQLKELLGEAVLRELLDAADIEALERSLQRLDEEQALRNADDLHDLLLGIGDLTEAEIRLRCRPGSSAGPSEWLRALEREKRILLLRFPDGSRWVAAEDAARFRDALGSVLPRGVPTTFLEPVAGPLEDLVSRYARTHGPFKPEDVAERLGLGVGPVLAALQRLAVADRVLEGEFLPGGSSREWCDAEVLRRLKRRSLARLRREVEPVEQAGLARFLLDWQGLSRRRKGPDALLAVIEQLQGCPLPASVLETEVLPSRLEDYEPADLDQLCASGEILWRGLSGSPGEGRMALYLRDQYARLAPPPTEVDTELAQKIRSLLATRGAVFFQDIVEATGEFTYDVLSALWALVWSGVVTNDTLAPLRSMQRPSVSRGRRVLRHRRRGPAGSEGRWSLLPATRRGETTASSGAAVGARSGRKQEVALETERRMALATALLDRYGILTREALATEGHPGGFSAVYPVLKAMEESGRVRRGYFIEGLGATQFAVPGADERLRSLRTPLKSSPARMLAATDPANPYGAALRWPEPLAVEGPADGHLRRVTTRLERRAGARVILKDGVLLAYLALSNRNLVTFLPEDEPDRRAASEAIVEALVSSMDSDARSVFMLPRVDGYGAVHSTLAPLLSERGFTALFPEGLRLLRKKG
jgi:ATP-dependent Lhr-like helicase